MIEKNERIIHTCDRERVQRLTAYASSFVGAVLAVVLCLGVQARADHREQEQRRQLQEQATQQHAALCAVIAGLDDNAVEVPATTPLGRKNATTYAELRVSQGCPPRTER